VILVFDLVNSFCPIVIFEATIASIVREQPQFSAPPVGVKTFSGRLFMS
jgi:hypothetical protein